MSRRGGRAFAVVARLVAGLVACLVACLLLGALLAAASDAHAEAPPRPQLAPGLCKGCLYLPAKGERRPLVILLHGDRQSASRMLAALRKAATEREIALLAPPCPEDLGCDSKSFWRWGGDPAWLADLVDRAAAAYSIDPERVSLVGWSGGATYLGAHMAALPDRFNAAVLVGGGSPNAHCAAAPLPIFMLQGDRNPLHRLAVALHRRLVECHHDVTWQLVRRADHAAEWRAFTRAATQRTIFDFLNAHPRRSNRSADDESADPPAR